MTTENKTESEPEIDTSHGSPYDRGGADFWYARPRDPHKYPNGTYNEPRIGKGDLTPEEIAAYNKGYSEAEAVGDQKDWG